jgi:phage repressor protein C with HTH and peptisase S24 domain
MLLKHADIWQAIDDLARDHGFTVSGLARRAGLDATTFNKSKRVSVEGRPRWPSLESVSKILDVTGVTPLDFFGYSASPESGSKRAPLRRLPTSGIRQIGERESFDAQGHPKGKAWDALPFPELPDRNAYGLVMAGDSAEPVYRDGDLLVASPRAALRRGDRAVIRSISGRMRVCEFLRRSGARYEIRDFSAEGAQTIDAREVAFAHRIVWASQ